MKFSIREKRLAAGLTQEDMASRLDISTSLYNGLEKGNRRMNETYMDGIAKILGVMVSDLIIEERPTATIVGKVGAGARVPVFEAYEPGQGPKVARPRELPNGGAIAVEIEGDSMEPVYSEGDLLFFLRYSDDGVPTEAIGRRCVCETTDGLGWVKQVKRGSEPGLFNLISLNPGADNMHDVKLKWAAPVLLHWPAQLVRKP